MRTNPVFFLVVLLLAGTLACGGEERTSATSEATQSSTAVAAHSLTPEQLGELGAQIRKTPERAEELLREHNFTRESFEQAIRSVTEDAEASKRYSAAYRKASA